MALQTTPLRSRNVGNFQYLVLSSRSVCLPLAAPLSLAVGPLSEIRVLLPIGTSRGSNTPLFTIAPPPFHMILFIGDQDAVSEHPPIDIVHSATKGTYVKTNYVLIDYENVQPATIAVLDQDNIKLIVFIGANQAKIPFDIAAALQRLGARAEYIKISGHGSNALDFHIAFYVGQLAVHEPDAYFHIISKDTGFDPLIQHLKSKKILACRSSDVAHIPFVKATHATSLSEKLAVIVTNMQQRGASKPRTVKTLSSTINALFQKQLSEDELSMLVKALRKQGVITVNDTEVSYALPT